MAHGENAEKGGRRGYEYWSRRPLSRRGGATPGRYTKLRTHRLERRAARDEIRRRLRDLSTDTGDAE